MRNPAPKQADSYFKKGLRRLGHTLLDAIIANSISYGEKVIETIFAALYIVVVHWIADHLLMLLEWMSGPLSPKVHNVVVWAITVMYIIYVVVDALGDSGERIAEAIKNIRNKMSDSGRK